MSNGHQTNCLHNQFTHNQSGRIPRRVPATNHETTACLPEGRHTLPLKYVADIKVTTET